MKKRLAKIRGIAFGIQICVLLSSVAAFAEEIVQNNISVWEETVFNEMELFTISIEKRDADTNALLAGTIFGLYTENEVKMANGTVAIAAGTLLETVVSDVNGQATFTTKYPRGTYCIKEIQAPAGYKTAAEQIVFLNKDTRLTFYNEWVGGTITAIKKLPVSSHYEPHGDETFIFQLSGTDRLGNEHNYYESVTFTKDSPKTEDGNYYVLSATFDELALGTYILSEIETIRYELQSIEDISENAAAGNETVSFDVTLSSLAGSATFANEKVVWDDYSHTDCVVNVIAE